MFTAHVNHPNGKKIIEQFTGLTDASQWALRVTPVGGYFVIQDKEGSPVKCRLT